MKPRRSAFTPEQLLRAAAAAGVDTMAPEDRREWLLERGWAVLDYYRAQLRSRREHARRVQ